MTGAEKRRPGRTELSDDLRCHVINAVAGNNTDKRLGPGMASALRRLQRVETGEMSWAPTGGDRRLGRIEAHRNYQLGVAGLRLSSFGAQKAFDERMNAAAFQERD